MVRLAVFAILLCLLLTPNGLFASKVACQPMDYLLHVIVVLAVYTILAVSYDLLAGHTGLLSVAHAAFYGVGAYTSAILVTDLRAPFLVGMLGGMMTAGVLSIVISLVSVRLREEFFVVATFGFQMMVFSVLNNWTALTRGPLGIGGIPEPRICGLRVDSQWRFTVLSVCLACAVYVVVRRISVSPFGRVLHAMREDDGFAESLGKNTARFKIIVFAVSSALAASAGSLYAHYISFIDPASFTVMESILIVSIVIIGGVGSRWGPVVGAVVLVTLPEVLRFIGLPSAVAANVRQILYGAALVGCMMWRPQGLLGEYAFQKGSPRQ